MKIDSIQAYRYFEYFKEGGAQGAVKTAPSLLRKKVRVGLKG